MDKNNELTYNLLQDYELTVARLLLLAIDSLPYPLGMRRSMDMLKGNRSAFSQQAEITGLELFSVMPGFTRDQLSDLLDKFILQGFLVLQPSEEDKESLELCLTAKAREFIRSAQPAPSGLLTALMDLDADDINEDDLDLYYKLKLTRRQLAEEEDIAAYMVCPDEVLRSICLKKPETTDDLLKIKGTDEAFIQQYGKSFLYIIRQYLSR